MSKIVTTVYLLILVSNVMMVTIKNKVFANQTVVAIVLTVQPHILVTTVSQIILIIMKNVSLVWSIIVLFVKKLILALNVPRVMNQ